MNCPHCNKPIPDADIARHMARKSHERGTEARREASRRNGAKGGRPRTKRKEEK